MVILGFDGGRGIGEKGRKKSWRAKLTGVMRDGESSDGERKEGKTFQFFTNKHERKKKENLKPIKGLNKKENNK